jgi:hypothetical protein
MQHRLNSDITCVIKADEITMFKKLGATLLLLVLLLGAVMSYYWAVSTPQYALIELANGIEKQKYPTVDKRVNLDLLIGHAAEQALQQQVKQMQQHVGKQSNPLFAAMGHGLGQGFIQMMKPAMVAQGTDQLKNYVLSHDNRKYFADLGNKTTMLLLLRKADHVTLTASDTTAQTATFTLSIDQEPVTITLAPTGPAGWEVTQVDLTSAQWGKLMGNVTMAGPNEAQHAEAASSDPTTDAPASIPTH